MRDLAKQLVMLVLVAALCLTGCGKKEDTSSAAKWTIGMSQCNLGEPWRVQMNADVKNAADQHDDIKVVFKDAQNDTLKQRSQMEEFVSAGVDLIIILDRRILGEEYTCFIGADNKKIGVAAGKWITEKLGGKGKVIELKGLMTSTPGQDRHMGFREGIKDADIEIVFEADMKWLEPNARKEMESALARFETIDLVYAHNDPGAHGAYLAAKAAGREKDILFVGIDALPQEGQAYVAQGVLAASFEYPTGGKEAIDTALEIFDGQTVEKEIVLGSRVFTEENINKGGELLGQ